MPSLADIVKEAIENAYHNTGRETIDAMSEDELLSDMMDKCSDVEDRNEDEVRAAIRKVWVRLPR